MVLGKIPANLDVLSYLKRNNVLYNSKKVHSEISLYPWSAKGSGKTEKKSMSWKVTQAADYK